ncbi:MAG: hypothetical protein J6T74_01265, partial [Clostridia bacterium]|nr:hypothetical protein [Clostridia bacterium]
MSGRVDGYVTIEAQMDTDKFDYQLKELENKYKNVEIDIDTTSDELIKAEVELDAINQRLEKQKGKYEDLKKVNAEYNELIRKTREEIKAIGIPTTLEDRQQQNVLTDIINKTYGKIQANNINQELALGELTKIREEYEKQETIVDRLNAKLEKQENSLDGIENSMDAITQKQNEYYQKINDTNLAKQIKEAEKRSEALGATFGNIIRKITLAGLAIIGIRTATSGISRIMSLVLGQNDALANKMNSIKSSIANALTPIVEKIINLILKLMGYINAIWKHFFGHNLFKSVKNDTKDISGNLSSGAKSAKEIRKQLAGFDEANVLGGNTPLSGGGSGVGSGGGSLGGLEIPEAQLPKLINKAIKTGEKAVKVAEATWAGIQTVTKTGSEKVLGTANATTKGVETAVSGIKNAINSLLGKNNPVSKHNDENIKANQKLMKSNEAVLKSENATDAERQKALKNLKILTQGTYEQATATSKNTVNQRKWVGELLNSAYGMDELYRSGKLTEEEQYEYYKMLQYQLAPALDKNTAYSFGLTEENKKLKTSFDKLDTKFSTQYSIELQQKGSTTVINTVNKVKDAFSKLGTTISEAFKKGAQAGLKVSDLSKIFHAEGGIVNMPGRGVPVHYAGEAGREGIIPMDNQQ